MSTYDPRFDPPPPGNDAAIGATYYTLAVPGLSGLMAKRIRGRQKYRWAKTDQRSTSSDFPMEGAP